MSEYGIIHTLDIYEVIKMIKVIENELDWDSITNDPMISSRILKRYELGLVDKFVERIIHDASMLILKYDRKVYINFSNDKSEAIIFYYFYKDMED